MEWVFVPLEVIVRTTSPVLLGVVSSVENFPLKRSVLLRIVNMA